MFFITTASLLFIKKWHHLATLEGKMTQVRKSPDWFENSHSEVCGLLGVNVDISPWEQRVAFIVLKCLFVLRGQWFGMSFLFCIWNVRLAVFLCYVIVNFLYYGASYRAVTQMAWQYCSHVKATPALSVVELIAIITTHSLQIHIKLCHNVWGK